jgi:hypothetical protein
MNCAEKTCFEKNTAFMTLLLESTACFWSRRFLDRRCNTDSNAADVSNEYLQNIRTGQILVSAPLMHMFFRMKQIQQRFSRIVAKRRTPRPCCTKTLNAANRNWSAGTFVVRLSRNSENVHQAVARLAKELGVRVTAINSVTITLAMPD